MSGGHRYNEDERCTRTVSRGVEKSSTPPESIQTFIYGSTNIRIVWINQVPWFVYKDVQKACASSTQFSHLSDEYEPHEYQQVILPDARGVHQQTYIVRKEMMHGLAMRGNSGPCIAFRKWLRREVIPSIERTKYAPPPPPPHQLSTININ